METHLKEFLRALNERLPRDQMILQRMAEIEKPAPAGVEDLRRYLNDDKTVYAQNQGDMYERIASHGSGIFEFRLKQKSLHGSRTR